MNKSGPLTTLQRQTADLQGQMIESLAEGSLEMTGTLERAATVFEVSLTAQREAIASLSKTNEDLQAEVIALKARNQESIILLEARISALEEKLRLQSETQREELQRMLAVCGKIISAQKQTCPIVDLFLFRLELREGNRVCDYPGHDRMWVSAHIAQFEKEVDSEYHNFANFSSFVGKITLEIEILKTQITGLLEIITP